MNGIVNELGKHAILRFPKLIDDNLIENLYAYSDTIDRKFSNRITKRLRCSETYEETEKLWGKSHRPTVRRKVKKYLSKVQRCFHSKMV